jgi:hypothetical protein
LIIVVDGLILLHLAILCNDGSLVQYLLECGEFTMLEMDHKFPFRDYGTALQAAVYFGYHWIVQLLLEHKADANLEGN